MAETINDLIWAGVGITVNTAPQWIIILVPFRKKLNMKFGFVFAGCSLLVLLCAVGFALFPPELQTFSTFQAWIMAFLLPSLAFFLWVLNEKKSKLMYLFIIIAGIVIAISKTANFITLHLFDNPAFFHFAVVHTASRLITTPLLIIYIDRLIKQTLPIVESSSNRLWKIIWIIPAIFMLINLLYNPGFEPTVIMQPNFMVTNILVVVGTMLSSRVLVLTLQIVSETVDIKIEGERQKTLLADAENENAALDSLNRMKAQYLANMSHNIKTPLTAISVDIQKAARLVNNIKIENGELVIDERIAASLSRAQEEIMHAARLTESALRMAAMQESRDKMKLLDTYQLFINNTEAYRSHVEKQGNVLKITTDKNLPQIFGNADELMGVLTNLLTNANRHTKNGEIKVQITNYKAQIGEDDDFNEPYIAVTVKDNGTGIPPELLPYVFERGVTGANSTGMGLAISKKTIETHGGEISVRSVSGVGCEVTFTIPIYNEAGRSPNGELLAHATGERQEDGDV